MLLLAAPHRRFQNMVCRRPRRRATRQSACADQLAPTDWVGGGMQKKITVARNEEKHGKRAYRADFVETCDVPDHLPLSHPG